MTLHTDAENISGLRREIALTPCSLSSRDLVLLPSDIQSRFDARYWMLGAGALGRPRGMVRGGRREEGSGWGTRVYLWRIHVDIWQNQYNIVKLKNKIK